MKLGIIGGSGLYHMTDMSGVDKRTLKTPFGRPSDCYICGKMAGHEVFFLPRHGRGHRIMPSEINYRANIHGFKMLGVERVVSVSAVGSLKYKLKPGDVVLPDQYFDRTKNSAQHTFFGNGAVAHVAFSEPACPHLRRIIAACARKVVRRDAGSRKMNVHEGGTYVNMEGPAFSTRAESLFHKNLGYDVIGMTSLAEAKLCREAEMCYQSIAMVTDYDSWRDSGAHVSVEVVVAHLVANTELAKKIIGELVPALAGAGRHCGCGSAVQNAIVTDRKTIPAGTRKKLNLIIGRYL